jgi:hypothetical protein
VGLSSNLPAALGSKTALARCPWLHELGLDSVSGAFRIPLWLADRVKVWS